MQLAAEEPNEEHLEARILTIVAFTAAKQAIDERRACIRAVEAELAALDAAEREPIFPRRYFRLPQLTLRLLTLSAPLTGALTH